MAATVRYGFKVNFLVVCHAGEGEQQVVKCTVCL